MYFYKKNGKQCLDLTGCLIISFNTDLVKSRTSSASPSTIKAPEGYITNLGKAKFFNRVFITFRVIAFIWGKDTRLKREDTDYRESHRANVANTDKTAVVEAVPGVHVELADDETLITTGSRE